MSALNQSAYTTVPRKRFWVRFFPMTLIFTYLGIFAMGWISATYPSLFSPPVVRMDDPISGVAPVPPKSSEVAYVHGIYHWERVLFHLGHVPPVCHEGQALNDFQKSQCEAYWETLFRAGALAVFPFGLLLLLLFFGQMKISGVYRRAKASLVPSRMKGRAVVTSPAYAPQNFFSFLFGFRPIQVQLPQGGQTQVYIEMTQPIPLPGQTVLLYGPVFELGAPRYYGTLYMPNIAVVQGVRKP